MVAATPFPLSELSQKRVAIPGSETTAHFLLDHLLPSPKEKVFCLYHEIPHLLRTSQADCGVIIHESRFTFAQEGFVEIVDLGEMWHQKTHLPLPLGGVAIDRSLPDSQKKQILSILQDSLDYARSNPEEAIAFCLKHSQEKEEAIVKQHIDLYVNQETAALSSVGTKAIELLLKGKLPRDWRYG